MLIFWLTRGQFSQHNAWQCTGGYREIIKNIQPCLLMHAGVRTDTTTRRDKSCAQANNSQCKCTYKCIREQRMIQLHHEAWPISMHTYALVSYMHTFRDMRMRQGFCTFIIAVPFFQKIVCYWNEILYYIYKSLIK